jgi:hypothetical protein
MKTTVGSAALSALLLRRRVSKRKVYYYSQCTLLLPQFFISQRDCMVRNTRIGYNRSLYTQVEVKIHLFRLGTNKKKDHWSKKAI